MYVNTFYSFKGGVGRTMALVNTAFELTKRGRRVLLVDFDLEAPGLDTFDLPHPPAPTPGIVEYITDYLSGSAIPSVEKYLYEITRSVKRTGGEMWVMPAGLQDDTYGARLSNIDWEQLYATHDGYLMFEDLKRQWNDFIQPDYVLIDSRTGYTDESGICTRQLPDAVTVFFFPNPQNLRGLEKIVRDIRVEAATPRKKEIQLHFVSSNVPELEDEDGTLATTISDFQKKLHFHDRPLTIYHHNTLSTANQTIFTRDKESTRIAGEYRTLTDLIVRHNPDDHEGALAFLNQQLQTYPLWESDDMSALDIQSRVRSIEELHSDDPLILQRLATYYMRQGAHDEALPILDSLVDDGNATPETFLRRADCRRWNDDISGATEDAKRLFELTEATGFHLMRAIRTLRMTESSAVLTVAKSRALMSLDATERIFVASQLSYNSEEMKVAKEILREVIGAKVQSSATRVSARAALSLCEIHLQEFDHAIATIQNGMTEGGELGQRDAFNVAIATWGSKGEPDEALFRPVVEADPDDHRGTGGNNYLQCLALARWAVGDVEGARARIAKARLRMRSRPSPELSCWRYLTLSPNEFLKDLEELERLVDGNDVVPTVLSRSAGGADSHA